MIPPASIDAIDWSGLDIALATPSTIVDVDAGDLDATVTWQATSDFGLVARARLQVLKDRRVEWTLFWVEPEYRGQGIYTAALNLQDGWLKDRQLGPSVIRRNANDAVFYRQAGFRDEPNDGPFMEQDPKLAKAWLNRKDA